MQQYGLGPNGGIITSLNLFATKFDQVLGIMENRASNLDYIFIGKLVYKLLLYMYS